MIMNRAVCEKLSSDEENARAHTDATRMDIQRSVLHGWKPIIRAADPKGNDNCGRHIILNTTSLAAAVRNSASPI